MPGMGRIKLEVTCADLPGYIRKLTEAGISLGDIQSRGDLTVTFSMDRADLPKVRQYSEKYGCQLRILGKDGLIWALESFLRRGVLVLGLLLILMGLWILSGRVLILQVEGNEGVPSRQILEAAEDCGIRFGVSSRNVRSEKMKNALLSRLPQLQWAGINTYGCRAVITVRERKQEVQQHDGDLVSSIVAARDGMILSCTVTGGNGLVTPGQAVRAGEVLISGYTDCGLSICATQAQGEIIARTHRDLTAKTPTETQMRTQKGGSRTKYSLIIGKKRINFYKGSGISDTSCVKMYWEYVLTLPSGFQLPVSLRKETQIDTALETGIRDEEEVRNELTQFAESYLRQQMIGGTVTGKEETILSADACVLVGQYQCQEMIGRVRPERIGAYNGKTD